MDSRNRASVASGSKREGVWGWRRKMQYGKHDDGQETDTDEADENRV